MYRNLLLMFVAFLLLQVKGFSQLISGNAFLKGNYVEVGMAPYGCWGTTVNAPAGYHARSNMNADGPAYGKLGFVADPFKDGWTVGTPNKYYGDYFLAANPYAGFGFRVGATDYFSERFNDGAPGAGMGNNIGGALQSVVTTASQSQAVWETTLQGVLIRKIVTVPADKAYFIVRTVFKNTSATAKNTIYYMEYINPDNDGGYQDVKKDASEYYTRNTIVYQNPADHKALVKAVSERTQAYLGLGSMDCRAKVFRGPVSQSYPTNGRGAFQSYNGLNSILLSGGDAGYANLYMGVAFNIGTIAAGDSTAVTYAYILAEGDLDEALGKTDPVFLAKNDLYYSGEAIKVCVGETLPLTLSNGDDFTWTWTPNSNISTTTGTNVNVTAGNTPVQYTLNGTSSCGSKSVNIRIEPVPVSTSTDNITICTTQLPYTWNGLTVTAGGVAAATYKTTNQYGCDSTVTLNLTVQSCAPADCQNTIIPYTITTKATPDNSCGPASVKVGFANLMPTVTGLTYQWQSSPDGNNAWTNVGSEQSTPDYTLPAALTKTTWLRCAVLCHGSLVVVSSAKQVVIQPNETPTIAINPNSVKACTGSVITVTTTLTGGGSSPSYQWWINGDPVPGANTSTLTLPQPTDGDEVKVTVTNTTTCATTATASSIQAIAYAPLPAITLTKSNDINCAIGSATLTATGGGTYEWMPVEGLSSPTVASTIARPFFTTTYTVKVTTAEGCSDTKSITVNISSTGQYSIPNAFTPNGDGRNDCFGLLRAGDVTGIRLSVYNRWGVRVFYGTGSNACWDGRYGGQQQPTGTYVYILEGKSLCGDIHRKGTVELIR